MGVKLTNKKPFNPITSFVYRVGTLLPIASTTKFSLFSDLSWIFSILAQQNYWTAISLDIHPIRQYFFEYIKNKINKDDTILDIGCSRGEISFGLAGMCKQVIGIDYNQDKINDAIKTTVKKI